MRVCDVVSACVIFRSQYPIENNRHQTRVIYEMETMRTKMESAHNDMLDFVIQYLLGISATVEHIIQVLQIMPQQPYKFRVSKQTQTCEKEPALSCQVSLDETRSSSISTMTLNHKTWTFK